MKTRWVKNNLFFDKYYDADVSSWAFFLLNEDNKKSGQFIKDLHVFLNTEDVDSLSLFFKNEGEAFNCVREYIVDQESFPEHAKDLAVSTYMLPSELNSAYILDLCFNHPDLLSRLLFCCPSSLLMKFLEPNDYSIDLASLKLLNAPTYDRSGWPHVYGLYEDDFLTKKIMKRFAYIYENFNINDIVREVALYIQIDIFYDLYRFVYLNKPYSRDTAFNWSLAFSDSSLKIYRNEKNSSGYFGKRKKMAKNELRRRNKIKKHLQPRDPKNFIQSFDNTWSWLSFLPHDVGNAIADYTIIRMGWISLIPSPEYRQYFVEKSVSELTMQQRKKYTMYYWLGGIALLSVVNFFLLLCLLF